MSIWCAIILSVGIVVAAAVSAIGRVLGGLFSNPQSYTLFCEDEDWEKIESRTINLSINASKKMVDGMFGD